jgi:hypothetical protein
VVLDVQCRRCEGDRLLAQGRWAAQPPHQNSDKANPASVGFIVSGCRPNPDRLRVNHLISRSPFPKGHNCWGNRCTRIDAFSSRGEQARQVKPRKWRHTNEMTVYLKSQSYDRLRKAPAYGKLMWILYYCYLQAKPVSKVFRARRRLVEINVVHWRRDQDTELKPDSCREQGCTAQPERA